MKKIVFMLVAFSSLAWADVVCNFYSYNCVPELDMVEVRMHKISNTEICQRVTDDAAFRESLRDKNYITPSSPYYYETDNGRTWMLNSDKPYIDFGARSCTLSSGVVDVTITPYALNENANGRCGGEDNDIIVNMEEGKRRIFKGSFEDDCHTLQHTTAVRYSVEKRNEKFSRTLEFWAVDGEGQLKHEYEFIYINE